MSKAIFPALALLALTCSSIAATPTKPHKRRQVATTASAPATRKHAKVAPKGTLAKGRGLQATKATARRKGKTSRAASRSYQQAPTPDRYKEIQAALASKGYFKGEPNGEWGPDSTDALKRFQSDQNLMPDGKVNSLSLIALGLGPKRLTAKSEAAPPAQPPASGTSPGSVSAPATVPPPPR